MLVDFRYHLGSLIAVFLALGIGILMGHGILGKEGILEEQQRFIVNELEERFTRLKGERDRLSTDLQELNWLLEKEREFGNLVLSTIGEESLENQQILLLVTGSTLHREEIVELQSVLTRAGAQVSILQAQWQERDWAARLVHALDNPSALGELLAARVVTSWQDGINQAQCAPVFWKNPDG